MDYKKAYMILFNTIIRAIEELQRTVSSSTHALKLMEEAQLKTEKMYIESHEPAEE